MDAIDQTSEDADDIRAFDEAIAESGENITWLQALAELGWV
jgi:hypothetical protein